MRTVFLVVEGTFTREVVAALSHHDSELVVLDLPLIAASEGLGDALVGGFAGATLQKPGTEPKWNLVLPKGKWHGPNFARLGGSIDVTDDMVGEIVANWEAAGKPRLPIRWGHEHLSNTDAAKQALLDRKAGNLVELRAGAQGLEALTAWNELGAKDIDSGAFDAWSPEWYPSHTSRKSGETKGWWLGGVALTGDPYFHLMPPVAASAVADPTDPPATPKGNTMNEEQLKSLRAHLGLAADASVEVVLAAAAKAGAALTASSQLPQAITAAVKPVQDQVVALTAALEAEKTKGIERDVMALIATAKRGDGKMGRAITEPLVLVAKNIAKTEGLAASEAFLTALPCSVPMVATGVEGDASGPLTKDSAQKKLNARAEELRVAKVADPMFAAMKEMPDVALVASSTPTRAA